MVQHQVLVRLVDGRTRCLQFPGRRVCGAEIKARVQEIDGIPVELQRLVTGTKQLSDGDDIQGDSCAVLLRLRGGKGGFGSLLRGAATGGRHKKTSNYDACRDMSGRRLRHVNAEKKLKEWKEEAELRELEKQAENYLKQRSKKKVDERAIAEELHIFRELTEKNMEKVEEAVMDGLKQARKLGTDGKRKKVEPSGNEAKKLRLALEDDDDDDDDSSLFSEPLFGSSSGASSSRSESPSNDAEDREDSADECKDTSVQAPADQEPEPAAGEHAAQKKLAAVPELPEEEAKEPEPALNFDEFASAKDMEALGPERLKVELQKRGMKCGGSLSERAARLFLLKTTPIAKLDKKHFAKLTVTCKPSPFQ